jgi:superfamily I DNA and/or RNA helicase
MTVERWLQSYLIADTLFVDEATMITLDVAYLMCNKRCNKVVFLGDRS